MNSRAATRVECSPAVLKSFIAREITDGFESQKASMQRECCPTVLTLDDFETEAKRCGVNTSAPVRTICIEIQQRGLTGELFAEFHRQWNTYCDLLWQENSQSGSLLQFDPKDRQKKYDDFVEKARLQDLRHPAWWTAHVRLRNIECTLPLLFRMEVRPEERTLNASMLLHGRKRNSSAGGSSSSSSSSSMDAAPSAFGQGTVLVRMPVVDITEITGDAKSRYPLTTSDNEPSDTFMGDHKEPRTNAGLSTLVGAKRKRESTGLLPNSSMDSSAGEPSASKRARSERASSRVERMTLQDVHDLANASREVAKKSVLNLPWLLARADTYVQDRWQTIASAVSCDITREWLSKMWRPLTAALNTILTKCKDSIPFYNRLSQGYPLEDGKTQHPPLFRNTVAYERIEDAVKQAQHAWEDGLEVKDDADVTVQEVLNVIKEETDRLQRELAERHLSFDALNVEIKTYALSATTSNAFAHTVVTTYMNATVDALAAVKSAVVQCAQKQAFISDFLCNTGPLPWDALLELCDNVQRKHNQYMSDMKERDSRGELLIDNSKRLDLQSRAVILDIARFQLDCLRSFREEFLRGQSSSSSQSEAAVNPKNIVSKDWIQKLRKLYEVNTVLPIRQQLRASQLYIDLVFEKEQQLIRELYGRVSNHVDLSRTICSNAVHILECADKLLQNLMDAKQSEADRILHRQSQPGLWRDWPATETSKRHAADLARLCIEFAERQELHVETCNRPLAREMRQKAAERFKRFHQSLSASFSTQFTLGDLLSNFEHWAHWTIAAEFIRQPPSAVDM